MEQAVTLESIYNIKHEKQYKQQKIDLNLKIKNVVHHMTVSKVKWQPTKHAKIY